VQDIASAITSLAIVLPLITFALFILAVWLSKGRRRPALRMTGWCFALIGLIVLLARRYAGLRRRGRKRRPGHRAGAARATARPTPNSPPKGRTEQQLLN
jgi:peptidoglycan/LPS O-acetylase OafA/YrhL